MSFRNMSAFFLSGICVGFSAIFATSTDVQAAEEPRIFWEINNRFAPFETLRLIDGGLADRLFSEWAFDEEHSAIDWHKQKWERGLLHQRPDEGNLRGASPYAEFLGKPELHWDAENEEHHELILKYAREETDPEATVSISLWSNYAGGCTWEVDGFESLASQPVPCETPIKARIPLSGANVTLTTENGSHQSFLEPEHLVIVGFGGSYGAGEGNPDRPTRWKKDLVPPENTVRWLHNRQNYENGGEAAWLDDDCHRSFFSQQTLTALSLASEYKHRFVSFLHYACTGADIFFGHLAPQGDPGLSDGYSKYAQINAAIRDLCRRPLNLYWDYPDVQSRLMSEYGITQTIDLSKFAAEMRNGFDGTSSFFQDEIYRNNSTYSPYPKSGVLDCPEKYLRAPDLVLLEAGGNEIGFSSLVQFWIVPHSFKLDFLRDELIPEICPEPSNRFNTEDINERCGKSSFSIRELRRGVSGDEEQENSGRLIDQFDYYYAQVSSKLKISPKQIVQILYPDPLRDDGFDGEQSLNCRDEVDLVEGLYGDLSEGNAGYFSGSPWEAIKSAAPGNFFLDPARDKLLSEWNFNMLRRESVCLLNQANDLRSSIVKAANRNGVGLVEEVAEAFVGHSFNRGGRIGLPSHTREFFPHEWEPYIFDEDGRAVRTSNDSYLTQSQGNRKNYYGTAHPNLLGHALIANAVIQSEELGRALD